MHGINIDPLPLTYHQPGAWPATQACALMGKQPETCGPQSDSQRTELQQAGPH